MARRGLLNRIGPAFVVGACIIGPGSVTLMTKTGAKYQYQMIWLSLAAGALMAGFLGIFMRFGIYSEDTFLGVVRKRVGGWFAVLCGISLFSIDAAFQFGNCLGVTAGMEALVGGTVQWVWPVAFTVAAIVFMFSFKRIYGIIEKVMIVFLLLMLAAFVVNLVMAKHDLGAIARGAFVPSLPKVENPTAMFVTLGGLVATTFVIVAAFFQAYTVKAKGWHEGDLADGITDTVLASVIFTLVGTVIMMTAAATLYPHEGNVGVGTMIKQLAEAFGPGARFIFALGFWAAAFSSFVTNSLIGGVLLNDGLGLGGRLDSTSTKVCATVVLLVGLGTSLIIIAGKDRPASAPVKAVRVAAPAAAPVTTAAPATSAQPEKEPKKLDRKVQAIAIGQACTLLAVPLGVVAMVIVLFDKRAVKGRALGWFGKAFVLFGAMVLLGVAALMFVHLGRTFGFIANG